jgi:hypothetical protein
MLPPGFDPDPLDDTDIFSLETNKLNRYESSQPGKAADSELLSEQDSMLHTSCKSYPTTKVANESSPVR